MTQDGDPVLNQSHLGIGQPVNVVVLTTSCHSKAAMLKEVASEHEAGKRARLVTSRDPRASHDHIVTSVETGRREIGIQIMRLEIG